MNKVTIALLLSLMGCSYRVEKAPEGGAQLSRFSSNAGFAEVDSLILAPKCARCHSTDFVGNFDATQLLLADIAARVQSTDPAFMMPPPGSDALAPDERAALLAWIAKGGPRQPGGPAPDPVPPAQPSLPPPGPPPLNFATVSAQVFQPKCIRCHRNELDTFQNTQPLLKEIEFRVQAIGEDEQMPPPNKPQLTDEEKDLLLRWIQTGAPET